MIRMLFAIHEAKSLILLTGETGCGKTFLLNAVRRELMSRSYRVAMITSPSSDPLDLLRQISLELGIHTVEWAKSEILHALRKFLVYHMQKNSRTVLIVDDADTIDGIKAFEELKLLLNLEKDGRFLLTLTLAGQPRLKGILKKVPSLNQRVALNSQLPPLSEEDAFGYINHRLKRVNGSKKIFSYKAMKEIYKASRGFPRRINDLCDLALLIGFSERRSQVDVAAILEAKSEFKGFGIE